MSILDIYQCILVLTYINYSDMIILTVATVLEVFKKYTKNFF